jgi:multidrug transporter EmrE-like cation transporter
MYGIGAFFGALALAISHLSAGPAYSIAGGTVVGVLAAVALMERAPYERQVRKAQ